MFHWANSRANRHPHTLPETHRDLHCLCGARGPDYYHTCYALSGLSVAQYSNSTAPTVYGAPTNLVVPPLSCNAWLDLSIALLVEGNGSYTQLLCGQSAKDAGVYSRDVCDLGVCLEL